MLKPIAFQRLKLAEIEKCYATLGVIYQGETRLFYGAEGNGSLQFFCGKNYEERRNIWEGGGGTMSIVSLHNGMVLASRGFYSLVDCAGSTVELLRPVGDTYVNETIATLDYLHRFDTLLAPDGTRYLFCAALHSGKQDKADWSKPGHVYAGAMPSDLSKPFTVELTQLEGEFFINHGFCKATWKGCEAGFIACKEGVFLWLPPKKVGDEWKCEQLLSFPVSDISVADTDGDGEAEIAALLPFHGNEFKIYRKDQCGYTEVFSNPVENDFYHAIINGSIRGERVFVCGSRKLAAETVLVRWNADEKRFERQQLEEGGGPSNLALLHTPDADLLLSANRMTFEAVAFKF